MEPLDPKRYKISYTWKQSSPSMNPCYNYNTHNEHVERELDLLDAIDLIVDTMDDYPEARKLLEGIRK